MPLVEVEDLQVHFTKEEGLMSKLLGKEKQTVYAVDGVDFEIDKETTFGLVGESGCGKSTIARSILQLVKPTSGQVRFDNIELTNASNREIRSLRRRVQMIFQDPRSSLNPRKTAEEIIEQPFNIHKELRDRVSSVDAEIDRLFELVGLSSNARHKFPHEFSGGQARRIGIARALAVRPDLLVCDEPTAGLDVSIMAAIINLMLKLQKELNLTFLWISHNLHVVKHLSDNIGVMYLGKMVEQGEADEIFGKPLHPYTEALFSSVPQVGGKNGDEGGFILEGEVPSPINPPAGCSFHPRCKYAESICQKEEPQPEEIEEGRFVACHLY